MGQKIWCRWRQGPRTAIFHNSEGWGGGGGWGVSGPAAPPGPMQTLQCPACTLPHPHVVVRALYRCFKRSSTSQLLPCADTNRVPSHIRSDLAPPKCGSTPQNRGSRALSTRRHSKPRASVDALLIAGPGRHSFLPVLPPPQHTAALCQPPCVKFHRVVAPLRDPGESPVLPFACCVVLLPSVGRCGWCSCWCRFRIRGAQ